MAATHYFISVGSNVANGGSNVAQAIEMLREMLDDFAASSVYTTPSVSPGDDSTYFNAVVGGSSLKSAPELSRQLKGIERQFGRNHDGMPHRVELDLDVVIAGNDIVRPRDYARRYFQIGYSQLTETAQ